MTDMKKKKLKYDEYGNIEEKSRFGNALSILVIMISVAIFAVIFLRIYQARDSEISDRIIMDDHAHKAYSYCALDVKLPQEDDPHSFFFPEDGLKFNCYSVHPATTMDADGRLQIRNVYYLDSADNLQMTIRLNTRYYGKNNGLGYDLRLKLIDEHGNVSYTESTYSVSDVRWGYTFIRVAFSNVDLSDVPSVRLQLLPQNSKPGDAAYANIKVFGSDVYKQATNIYSLDTSFDI